MKTFILISGSIWVLNALFSIAQHEWYHALLEGFISLLLFLSVLDENQ